MLVTSGKASIGSRVQATSPADDHERRRATRTAQRRRSEPREEGRPWRPLVRAAGAHLRAQHVRLEQEGAVGDDLVAGCDRREISTQPASVRAGSSPGGGRSTAPRRGRTRTSGPRRRARPPRAAARPPPSAPSAQPHPGEHPGAQQVCPGCRRRRAPRAVRVASSRVPPSCGRLARERPPRVGGTVDLGPRRLAFAARRSGRHLALVQRRDHPHAARVGEQQQPVARLDQRPERERALEHRAGERRAHRQQPGSAAAPLRRDGVDLGDAEAEAEQSRRATARSSARACASAPPPRARPCCGQILRSKSSRSRVGRRLCQDGTPALARASAAARLAVLGALDLEEHLARTDLGADVDANRADHAGRARAHVDGALLVEADLAVESSASAASRRDPTVNASSSPPLAGSNNRSSTLTTPTS